MAAFLFIIHYVRFENRYENYNQNADDIYRIALDICRGSEYVVTDCETHAPMGLMLKDKMSEVKDFVRMYHNDGLQDIRVGTRKFLEDRIYFADAVQIFLLDVLFGNPTAALTDPMQAFRFQKSALHKLKCRGSRRTTKFCSTTPAILIYI